MCVLRGPVSDLGLVPLGYKAWCWITTLLGPASAEYRGEREGYSGGLQQECVFFFLSTSFSPLCSYVNFSFSSLKNLTLTFLVRPIILHKQQ